MDTRQPLQTSPDAIVLSLGFSHDGQRLVCGLNNGIRAFRASDCVRTLKEAPDHGKAYALATALDDRYVVIVGGGRHSNATPNQLEIWDACTGQLAKNLDFHEQIHGTCITPRHLAVVLSERTVYLRFHHDMQQDRHVPGSVLAIHDTAPNPYGLCCIQGDRTVLPGLTAGQVQIVDLADKTKNIIRAHNSSLRQIDLSKDGQVLATASQQGTLIRVFSVSTLSQTHELRRGVDAAIIYSIAISPTSQFVACTSDKGTVHIFDLRAPSREEKAKAPPPPAPSQQPLASRRYGSIDLDAQSFASRSSAPQPMSHFSPPRDIAHAPPTNAPSALSALAKLPGMPKAFSDPRSLTSASYYLGTDPPNWQGQPAFVVTTLPNGQKGRVKNPNVPLPGSPEGRPPKGILCWDPDSPDRRLWCVGGGADPRWEVFNLLENDHRMKLVKGGYRNYLTRQFPDGPS